MTLRTPQRAVAVIAALAAPAVASAHPGHGLDPSGSSWLHMLGEPEHALPLLGAVALCVVLWGLAALSRRSS
jgi:hypothetical protein